MRLENAVAADVLERILSAYGFTMQKQLSDRLGIAKSNVASWLQRGQVPGNVLVQCALDTGADVQWLVTGEFANANIKPQKKCIDVSSSTDVPTGRLLIDKMLSNGGRPVISRVMDAYGFKTQKELCEYLGISTGTISTWVRREYFPGDVVITCAIDTGFSVYWLATGKGEVAYTPPDDIDHNVMYIPKFRLESGSLENVGQWSVDPTMFNSKLVRPAYIQDVKYSWLVDVYKNDLGNGRWLIGVDNSYEVYDVVKLPAGKVKLTNSNIVFECNQSDIKVYGAVLFTFEKHI